MVRRLNPAPPLQQEAVRAYIRQALGVLKATHPGASLTSMARLIGASPSTITRFMNSKGVTHTLMPQTLYRIQDITGVPVPQNVLDAYGLPAAPAVLVGTLAGPIIDMVQSEADISDSEVTSSNEILNTPYTGIKDLPIYAGVKDSLDGVLIDMSRRAKTDDRPVELIGVAAAYGVMLTSTNMVPRCFKGYILYVNPNLPCEIGDLVVVQISGNRAIVKELASIGEESIDLKQYNPPATTPMSRNEIKGIHKVILIKPR